MPDDPLKTIVFLPTRAADFVATHLRQAGYKATCVQTLAQLHEAFCSADYALTVTTRPDIDIIRHIRTIPVVNIEVFFDFAVDRQRDGTPRRFDGKSFIKRVTALTANSQASPQKAKLPNPASPSRLPSFRHLVTRYFVIGSRERRSVAE